MEILENAESVVKDIIEDDNVAAQKKLRALLDAKIQKHMAETLEKEAGKAK